MKIDTEIVTDTVIVIATEIATEIVRVATIEEKRCLSKKTLNS